jgi:hypothetical protein
MHPAISEMDSSVVAFPTVDPGLFSIKPHSTRTVAKRTGSCKAGVRETRTAASRLESSRTTFGAFRWA